MDHGRETVDPCKDASLAKTSGARAKSNIYAKLEKAFCSGVPRHHPIKMSWISRHPMPTHAKQRLPLVALLKSKPTTPPPLFSRDPLTLLSRTTMQTHLEHGPRRDDVSVIVVLDGVAEERLLVHRLPVREGRHVHRRQHVRVIRHRGLYRVWCEIDWSSGRRGRVAGKRGPEGKRRQFRGWIGPNQPYGNPEAKAKRAKTCHRRWPYKRGGTSRPQSKRRVRLSQRPPSPGRLRPSIGRGEAGRAGFVLVVSRNI